MTAALRIFCLSGPNLQLLGTREPEIYGRETLEQIHGRIVARGTELGVTVETRQTNHEGTLCDWIAEAHGSAVGGGAAGILLNAGAYTHTSLAIYDALRSVNVPTVEVHLSNPEARESFRHLSRIAPACLGKVTGFGAESYLLALAGLVARLRALAG
jgi:3-dehydroquinate dehydratase-2